MAKENRVAGSKAPAPPRIAVFRPKYCNPGGATGRDAGAFNLATRLFPSSRWQPVRQLDEKIEWLDSRHSPANFTLGRSHRPDCSIPAEILQSGRCGRPGCRHLDSSHSTFSFVELATRPSTWRKKIEWLDRRRLHPPGMQYSGRNTAIRAVRPAGMQAP